MRNSPMRIGFYAPMKPPGAPNPSGDRTIARLLVRALTLAGHIVEVLSDLRSWDGVGDPNLQARFESEARKEVTRILDRPEPRPDLLFTYHCHYKAPDLLGPDLAAAWHSPYVIAEGSYSPKRADGPWALFHGHSVRALKAATCHLVLSPRDRAGIDAIAAPQTRVLDLPPFLDTAPYAALDPPPTDDPVTILTVAMMRIGEKAWSYRFLIDALAALETKSNLPPWQWAVVGDGPARDDIKALAEQTLSAPVAWYGTLGPHEVCDVLSAAHIVAWPGLGEGIGMVFLEAQAAGRPVLAVDGPGPGSVIAPPDGGWLTAQDTNAFATKLADLIRNTALRTRIGTAGAARMERDHSLNATTRRLDRLLRRLVEEHQ